MPEFVGFQTMVILAPYGMTFDAVSVFGPAFWLLFQSGSSYCASYQNPFMLKPPHTKSDDII